MVAKISNPTEGLHSGAKTCSEVTRLRKAIYNGRILSSPCGSLEEFLFREEKKKQFLVRKQSGTCREDEQDQKNPPGVALAGGRGRPNKMRPPECFAFACQNIFAPST